MVQQYDDQISIRNQDQKLSKRTQRSEVLHGQTKSVDPPKAAATRAVSRVFRIRVRALFDPTGRDEAVSVPIAVLQPKVSEPRRSRARSGMLCSIDGVPPTAE